MASGTGGRSPLCLRLPTSTPACLGAAIAPSRVLFQANTYIPFLACQAGSRRVCSPWGCKPEQSNVLAGEGIWWGRTGAPSSHSSTPVLIAQRSAHTSPGTASLKGHSAAACPSRCWHSLPHLLLTLPNPATSSHTGQTPRKKRARLKADPEAQTPKVRSSVVVAPAGSRGCPVPRALLGLLPNSRWCSYLELLIIWRSKLTSAAKLRL